MTSLPLADIGVIPTLEARLGRGDACTGSVRFAVTDDLASLEPEWRMLEQSSYVTPFQSFDWLSAWSRIVGQPEGIQPAIVTGRRPDGTLLFIFPLAIKRSLFHRTLTFLGHTLCDYNAPLVADDC